MTNKEKLIDRLWECSAHGATRQDVENIYNQATDIERERCASIAECYELGTPDGHAIARHIRQA